MTVSQELTRISDLKVGEWVEVVSHGEILATGKVHALATGYVYVSVSGVGLYKLLPSEVQRVK